MSWQHMLLIGFICFDMSVEILRIYLGFTPKDETPASRGIINLVGWTIYIALAYFGHAAS